MRARLLTVLALACAAACTRAGSTAIAQPRPLVAAEPGTAAPPWVEGGSLAVSAPGATAKPADPYAAPPRRPVVDPQQRRLDLAIATRDRLRERFVAWGAIPRPDKPAPLVEEPGEPPFPGAIWVDGKWVWANGRWEWREGYWIDPGGFDATPGGYIEDVQLGFGLDELDRVRDHRRGPQVRDHRNGRNDRVRDHRDGASWGGGEVRDHRRADDTPSSNVRDHRSDRHDDTPQSTLRDHRDDDKDDKVQIRDHRRR